MAKMDLATLKTTIQGWLDETKQASATFTATTDNIYDLVDKIGDVVTISQNFQDKLPELDGADLPYGTTIEEYMLSLILPEANTFDQDTDSDNTIPYRKPVAEAPAYSYSFGKKRIPVSVPYNNVERAALNSTDAANFVTMITERLTNSESLYKYGLKKQLIGNMINKAVDASLTETIAIPTDTETSEAFIKAVKESVEEAAFANEGNALDTDALIGQAEELTLFVKKGVMPTVEVDALAGAFNKADLAIPARIKVLDDFGVIDNDNVYAVLVDTRGIKLRPHYIATRTDESGYNDFVTFTKHSEYTGFISKFTYVKVFKSE